MTLKVTWDALIFILPANLTLMPWCHARESKWMLQLITVVSIHDNDANFLKASLQSDLWRIAESTREGKQSGDRWKRSSTLRAVHLSAEWTDNTLSLHSAVSPRIGSRAMRKQASWSAFTSRRNADDDAITGSFWSKCTVNNNACACVGCLRYFYDTIEDILTWN